MATAHEQSMSASSAIPLPEIPVKLRCTICSELARGASRLPCCEQSICESCRSKLPDVCPVCDHSPLSANDCKPNAALRTTVAVFLRTAEKKHNLSMQKLQKEQAKPVEPQPEAKVLEPKPEKPQPTRASPVVNPLTPPQEASEVARSEGPLVSPPTVRESTEQPGEKSPREKEVTPVPDQQANGFVGDQNAWFGQSAAPMGGMPNMFSAHGVAGTPWGDYSMMQNIQGGWANGYGGMMGYTMGMNPMAMAQGGGFDGGSYGGMGMNRIGFNNGQGGGSMGWNNGWNGQSNVGFNPGIDGTRNGGFYSAASAGGYNHQSHGHHQMPQQYHNPHFQRQQPYQRGGRGGGFAGAGQRQVSLEHQQQNFQDAQFQQQIQGIDEAVAAVTTSGEKKGEKIQSVVSEDLDNIADAIDVPTDSASTVVVGGAIGTTEDLAESYNSITPVNPDMAAQYFPTDDFRSQGFQQQQQVHPMQFNNGFRGSLRRGGFRGDFMGGPRGGGHAGPIPTAPGSMDGDRRPIEGLGLGVEGAPTGPKALRERGLSRSGPSIRAGYIGRRGGGYPVSSWTRSISPDHAFSRSRSQDSRRRSRSPDRGRSQERDRSRDRSRDRRRSIRSQSRHRKHRSPSVEVNGERPRGRSLDRDAADPPSATANPPETANDVATTTTTAEAQEAGDKESITTATNGTQEPAPARSKRSRDVSLTRDQTPSRSRSRSPDRHHKRSRRHRRRTPSPDRDRDHDRDRDRDRSRDRRHKRHKHKSSKRHRHSRSRSPFAGAAQEPAATPTTAALATAKAPLPIGADVAADDRREFRHKRRSDKDKDKDRRDSSRHRSHRHKRDRERRDKDKGDATPITPVDREGTGDRHRDRDRRDRGRERDRERERGGGRERDRERGGEKDRDGKEKEKDKDKGKGGEDRKSRRDSRSVRKLSYKYDDEIDLGRQAEKDREAERWGIK